MTLPTSASYTLSLHDALPIWLRRKLGVAPGKEGPIRTFQGIGYALDSQGKLDGTGDGASEPAVRVEATAAASSSGRSPKRDRKSTRLNSSHLGISYAVFCLKK